MAKQMQVAFFKTGLKGVAHVAGWLYLAPWSIMEHSTAQPPKEPMLHLYKMRCPNPLAGPENSGRLPCLAGGTGGQHRRAGMWKKMAKQMQVAFSRQV